MLKKLTFALLCSGSAVAQVPVKTLFENALEHRKAYGYLEHLTQNIGPRLSGSPQAFAAADWAVAELIKAGADTAWKQEVPNVPRWIRGPQEQFSILTPNGSKPLAFCALGGSVPTPGLLQAQVVRFTSFDAMKSAGKEAVQGKVVFFDVPMDQKLLSMGHAYGQAVNYRWAGALEASKLGAIGVVIRSVSSKFDDYPHTGTMTYEDAPTKIPAGALGYLSADALAAALASNPTLTISWQQQCQTLPDTLGYSVIAEWRGSEFPNQYFVVGGHLDSWDLGQGAHDDGAGCVQSMEVPWLLEQSGYTMRHSLRTVLFINEENGLRGGRFYAEEAARKGEKHRFALESDGGGFTPQGFSFQTSEAVYNKIKETLKPELEPFGLYAWSLGGSGADISPLLADDVLLSGLRVDGQKYFDYHHAATDRLEAVAPRELEMGAAAMAALIMYLDANPSLLP